MLAYTLTRLLTERALIERDVGQVDAYGAGGKPAWQPLATVVCRLWWDRSSGARSANRTYVSPARTVPISQGGLMIPAGTDVTEKDRITRILSFDPAAGRWVPYVEGIFTISAVLAQEDHMELDIVRAHLGA